MYIKLFVKEWNETHEEKITEPGVRWHCAEGNIPGAEKVPMLTKNGIVIRERWDVPESLLQNTLLTNIPESDNVEVVELMDFLARGLSIARFSAEIDFPYSVLREVRSGKKQAPVELYRALVKRYPEYRDMITRVAFG
jgi:hypothetical protein